MEFWRSRKRWSILVALAAVLMLALAACAPAEAPEDPDEEPEEPEVANGEIEILMVDWDCATASSYLAAAMLEDMGYQVEITSVDAAVMWSGIATGDGDFITTAWLPLTHGDYWDEYGDDVVDVATLYEGARIGAVVPAYMDIDSIEEIDGEVDRIIGIDPGAGIMSATENAIETYDLDVELVEGSDAAMTAELMNAIDAEEPIVVTGWAPHWKFAEWDLKFLDDPEQVYGEEERIAVIGREGLEEDMPEVYAFLENFFLTDDSIGEVMAMNVDDPDFMGNAQQWIADNPDVVEQWMP